MGKIENYKDLIAWQKAMKLVVSIYRLTGAFPQNERYGLTSQLRRAAVSVPSNIAEGYGRGSRPDYVRFLNMARGSANEIEAQLLIAVQLAFVDEDRVDKTTQKVLEVQRILKGLVNGLRRRQVTNGQSA